MSIKNSRKQQIEQQILELQEQLSKIENQCNKITDNLVPDHVDIYSGYIPNSYHLYEDTFNFEYRTKEEFIKFFEDNAKPVTDPVTVLKFMTKDGTEFSIFYNDETHEWNNAINRSFILTPIERMLFEDYEEQEVYPHFSLWHNPQFSIYVSDVLDIANSPF